MTQMQNLI